MLSNINSDIVSKTQAELHVYADGVLGNNANSGLQEHAGTGGSFSVTSGVVTFTVGSGTPFLPGDANVGKTITIDYATSSDNNGTFAVTGVPAPNQVTYTNVKGVTEALPAGGKWAVSSPKLTLAAVYALVPKVAQHNVCVHLSGTFSEFGSVPFEVWIPDSLKTVVVDGGGAVTDVDAARGTGGTFTKGAVPVPNTVTFTASGTPNFTTALIGKRIYIGAVGSITAGNSGNFIITAVPANNQLQWVNASGAVGPEVFTGSWVIYPYDVTTRGTGIDFVAGGGNVTLAATGAAFTQADVGKRITIAGSTTNDGTFTIVTVVDSTHVTYVSSGLTEGPFASGTWALGGFVDNVTIQPSNIGLSTAAWTVDQWVGCFVEVLVPTPTPHLETRQVHSNTATTITVQRNFSVTPTGCPFRFVRPATTFAASVTSSSMIFMSKGNGLLQWQRFTTLGTLMGVTFQFCDNMAQSHIFAETFYTGYGCQVFITETNRYATTANKYNPFTFALEFTTTDSQAGFSGHAFGFLTGNIYIRFNKIGTTYSVIAPVIFINKNLTPIVAAGCRILVLVFMGCPADAWTTINVANTTGYANTTLGGSPAFNLAGIVVRNSSLCITGCDINHANDYGIEMFGQSWLYLRATAIAGTSAKAGVYAHGSSTIFTLSSTPTISGTLIGNCTVDGATLATTWASVVGGTPFTSTEELVRIKRYIPSIGA